MTRPRTALLLEVVAAVLALLVLTVLLAVVVMISYPTAADRLLLPFIVRNPAALTTITTAQNVSAALFDRAAQGYSYRVERPLRRVLGAEPAQDARPAAVHTDTLTDSVCRPCHPEYAEKVRFAKVYFEHGKHSQVDGGCDACHTSHSVDRSPMPTMDGCADCHEETSDSESCVTCHPPGTVFHGAAQAVDRELGEQCVVCHPNGRPESTPRTHAMPTLATDERSCMSCHDADLCATCHPANHPRGYGTRHPADLSARRTTVSECWGCHSARWCTAACHSGGATWRAR